MSRFEARLIVPALLCVSFAGASTAHAQSDGRFALGASVTTRTPLGSADASGTASVGLLWRFGHSTPGWGWQWGMDWFATDLDRAIGGASTEFGELHVRPIMGGYGYTLVRGATSITVDAIAGYAFSSLSLSPAAGDAYRTRLGAQRATASASNTLAAKPEIEVWHDLNKRVGFVVNGGYLVARPEVTVTSSLGVDSRRLRADMFMLKLGLVYSLF